jgi:hypothetical protein
MMLHVLNNDTGHRDAWCGPAAISMLTGASVSVIECLVWQYRHDKERKVISGMSNEETLHILKELHAKVTPIKNFLQKKTLREFVDDTQSEPYPYLIEVREHYMITFKGKVVDNNQAFPHRPIRDKPKRQVKRAWRVQPLHAGNLIETTPWWADRNRPRRVGP